MHPPSLAKVVENHLLNGGQPALDRNLGEHSAELDRWMHGGNREDPMYSRIPQTLSRGGFVTRNEDGAAAVSYWGPPDREEGSLRLYRLVLENCLFSVTEEDDPAREGHKKLTVRRA